MSKRSKRMIRIMAGTIIAIASVYSASYLGSLEHRWWIFPTVSVLTVFGTIGLVMAFMSWLDN